MASNIVRRIIGSPPAPTPGGPYSPAVVVGQTMYISGMIGVLPSNKQLVAGGVGPETEQTLKNIGEVLKAAGISFKNVVKTTVLLTDINDYPAMNEAYAKFFNESKPARAAYQVVCLPNKQAKVEIEAVAVVGEIVEG
ncbi:2-iminobutanoate/2-iminopropanoate deaminase-like [Babylonia areolata]|uniref:2-iminobutanoate/2-iminopropanoate deaminase-like n=1 Tax=Babylonia areolata TaxID=304850 RepID=UPI003FCEEBF6